jgi:glycosyltransferase involved in cell wall biosynthesis
VDVCLVSRELYPFQKAGIGVYIHNLAESLIDHGHKVFIITSEENKINKSIYENKVEVIPIIINNKSLVFEDYNFAYSFAVYQCLKELTKKNHIDLIEFADYFGEGFFSVLFKKVRGDFEDIPFVLKLHTPTYECNLANQQLDHDSILVLQEDYTISNIDFVYAISYFMKNTIADRLQRDNIDVVYNLVNLPSPSRNSINDPVLSSKYLLFVGRLEERKGIDLFVDAGISLIEEGIDINFLIIGKDNPYKNTTMKKRLLEKIPESFRKFFHWKKPVNQEELAVYYGSAYASIFPSRFEGFGYVCVEAMKMGSPVIISDETALMEIIDNGQYGISFKNGDYKDLYLKIKIILNDKKKRDEMRNLSKIRAEYFATPTIYPIQISYYSKVKETYQQYKKRKNEITERLLIKSIDRISYFIAEEQRIISEWGKLSGAHEQVKDELKVIYTENQRLIKEWEGLSKINKGKNMEINKLNIETNRLEDEWGKLAKQNAELRANLTDSEKQKSKYKDENTNVILENKRVIGEWKKIREEYFKVIQENNVRLNELRLISDENKRIINEWEIMSQQIAESKLVQVNNNYEIATMKKQLLQLQKELETKKYELSETNMKIQSKKFLLKQLLSLGKGEDEK